MNFDNYDREIKIERKRCIKSWLSGSLEAALYKIILECFMVKEVYMPNITRKRPVGSVATVHEEILDEWSMLKEIQMHV